MGRIHIPPHESAIIAGTIPNGTGADIGAKEPHSLTIGVGIALNPIADGGAEGVLFTDCQYYGDCATATTYTEGAAVGWDATTKLCVAGGAGDFDIGKAILAKGAGPTEVLVKIAAV